MEFFKEVYSPNLDLDHLKKLLSVEKLASLCASINTVIAYNESEGDIYCIWGEFNIKREEIRYGVRFSLLNCPHALAWTITFNEVNQNIIIHCTIDKAEQATDFIESIHDFVEDWSNGLTKTLQLTSSCSGC